MYQLDGIKYFDSLIEAKMELIFQVTDSLMTQPEKGKLIEALKVSVEQHEDKQQLLQVIADYSTSENRTLIQPTLEILERSTFNVLPTIEMNTHPLVGASESFLPANLLMNPTTLMKEARDKVSEALIATLKDYREHGFNKDGRNLKGYFRNFAKGMIFETDSTYPGTFTLDEINQHLPDNDKITLKNLAENTLSDVQITRIIDMAISRLESKETKNHEIMAIHVQYSYSLLKFARLSVGDDSVPNQDNPVYKKIVADYNKANNTNISLDEFMHRLRDPDKEADKVRRFISDNMMYESDLYQVEHTRGRGNPDSKIRTNTMGVMRNTQPEMQQQLPKLDAHEEWVDWSKCPYEQHSKIVNSMTKFETPFISSYSGTTSLLANLMLSSNALKNLPEQQNYLNNIIGYISGMGYHSIQEILGPSAYCLNLIPGDDYPIDVPRGATHYVAPQYNSYYQLIQNHDPEFRERRDVSWGQFIQWHNQVYNPNVQPIPIEVVLKGIFENQEKLENRGLLSHLNILSGVKLDMLTYQKLSTFIDEKYPVDTPNAPTKLIIDDAIRSNILDSNNPIREIVTNLHTISEVLRTLSSEYEDLDFSYQSGQFKISSISRISGGYNIDQVSLTEVTDKISEALQQIPLAQEVIDKIIDQIQNHLIISTIIVITEEEIINGLKQAILTAKNKSFHSFDWQTFAENKKQQAQQEGVIEVLKEDPERKRIIIHDKDSNKVHKFVATSLNKEFEQNQLMKEKKLYELVNNMQYDFKVNNEVLEITMDFLGTPLSELVESNTFTADELDNLRTQARSLLQRVHDAGYVYGDARLDNFVYDQQTKTLHLIDFETATKLENDLAILHNFGTELMSEDIDPHNFRKQDDMKILDRVFNAITPAKLEPVIENSTISPVEITQDSSKPTPAPTLEAYEELYIILGSDDFIEPGAKLKKQIYPNICKLLEAIQNNDNFSAIKELALNGIELNTKIKEENPTRDPEQLDNRIKMFTIIEKANSLEEVLDSVKLEFPKLNSIAIKKT